MQYVAETAPEYSAISKRALMLPAQKHELPVMSFITKEEFNALIQVCAYIQDNLLIVGRFCYFPSQSPPGQGAATAFKCSKSTFV